jgi:hypothetical protein
MAKRKPFISVKRLYQSHSYNAKGRGIGFHFTLEEWIAVWVEALGPYWRRKRGRGDGKFCMARIKDQGNYEPGNVMIITNNQNSKEVIWTEGRRAKHIHRMLGNAHLSGHQHSAKTRTQMSKVRTGRKQSDISRARISVAVRASIAALSPEEKSERGRRARNGHTEETRKQISKTLTGRKHSADTRARMVAAQQRRRSMENLNQNEPKG